MELAGKRKQNNFELKYKAQLIEEYERLPDHPPFDIFGERYGLKKGIFNKWWRAKDLIKEQSAKGGASSSFKRIRKGSYEMVDDVMMEWLKDCNDAGVYVTKEHVREKAMEVWGYLKEKGFIHSSDEGKRGFKASEGWLTNLKRRRGITGQVFSGYQEPSLTQYLKNKDQIQMKIRSYSPENIYCFVESILLYKMTPEQAFLVKDELDKINSKDKVSFLFAVNATGADKKKLLVISNRCAPPSLKHINLHNLRIEHATRANSVVDGTTLKNWLSNFNTEMMNASRNILLLFQSHKFRFLPDDILFSNIQLLFCPRVQFQVQSQQDENEIAIAIKAKYRTRLVRRRIEMSNYGLEFSGPSLRECLDMLSNAWLGSIENPNEGVDSLTIRKHWLNANLLSPEQQYYLLHLNHGFHGDQKVTDMIPYDDLQQMLMNLGTNSLSGSLLSAQEFVEIEKVIPSLHVRRTEELVHQVLSSYRNDVVAMKDEDDDEREEVRISRFQAIDAIDILLRYLPQAPFDAISHMKNLKWLKNDVERLHVEGI